MTDAIRGGAQRLLQAAQPLYKRPSFKPVPYNGEAFRLPPESYKKWLHINPNFCCLGRNRWRRLSWPTWNAAWVKITETSNRARQDLRSLAIKEQDYRLALRQFTSSQPHERPLRNHLASMHLGEFEIEEFLLPFRRTLRQLEHVVSLISGAPPGKTSQASPSSRY